ncbi:MAG: FG-GAP-like repeat-containing protein [Terriglobia bacterium]
MSLPITRITAAFCLLLGTAILMPPAASQSTRSGQDVKAEFEEICHSLRNSPEPYQGEDTVRNLRWMLEASTNESEEAILRAKLARALLQQGKTEQAIELYSRALDFLESRNLGEKNRPELMFSLGVAHLRAAQNENCIDHRNPAACILPFRKAGIHQFPDHTRQAGDLFLRVLKENPEHVQAQWLLNISRMATDDYPAGVPESLRLPEGALEPEAPFPFWQDRAPDVGINAFDLAGGAIMDDFDGDGFLDLITSTRDYCDSLKAFRNDGRGRFEDVTVKWGLDSQWGGLNVVHADFDNDGRLDLLVLRGAWLGANGRIRNSLLRNELGTNGGRFVDVTKTAGLAEPAYPTQTAAWADYDGDGDLDLYVGNEATDQNPYPSQLFRNNNDGAFTDVTAQAGVSNLRYTKAVTWGDFDNDGSPDLYVSNIGSNRLYRNNGDGTFTDVALELGVAGRGDQTFATWFFDFDNDGDLDLFVASFNSPVSSVFASYWGVESLKGQPRVYRNEGGWFREVSRELGLRRPLLPMGANYGDVDNDGWLDLYLGTGNPPFSSLMPNILLRNEAGARFADVTFAAGVGQLQKGHGVAFGDVDNDGDQDLFHQLGAAFLGDAYHNALFENPDPSGNWITLRLQGRKANRFGVGARIEVRLRAGEKTRSIHLLAGSGGSFGGSSIQQEVGLGDASKIEEIIVHWPGSESVQRFRDVVMNRFYLVTEGKTQLVPIEVPRIHLGGHLRNKASTALP